GGVGVGGTAALAMVLRGLGRVVRDRAASRVPSLDRLADGPRARPGRLGRAGRGSWHGGPGSLLEQLPPRSARRASGRAAKRGPGLGGARGDAAAHRAPRPSRADPRRAGRGRGSPRAARARVVAPRPPRPSAAPPPRPP